MPVNERIYSPMPKVEVVKDDKPKFYVCDYPPEQYPDWLFLGANYVQEEGKELWKAEPIDWFKLQFPDTPETVYCFLAILNNMERTRTKALLDIKGGVYVSKVPHIWWIKGSPSFVALKFPDNRVWSLTQGWTNINAMKPIG